jgi:hypothetical protein
VHLCHGNHRVRQRDAVLINQRHTIGVESSYVADQLMRIDRLMANEELWLTVLHECHVDVGSG